MNSADRELLDKLLDSRSREMAFGILVKRYQEPLYRHVRRLTGNHPDADDALQNTFIKAWRHIESFKAESAIYTWLYRIAANEAIAIIRSRKPDSDTEEILRNHAATSSDGPGSDEIATKLMAALETLPERQRQVFDLKYFEEMQYDEIAIITGTSIGALKASYFHAVKKIEAFLKE